MALGVTRPVMPAVAALRMKPPYHPGAKFDVKVSEVESPPNEIRTVLIARIFGPSGNS